MKLYQNYVNYSVFDGEITLDSSAREHLLATVFFNDPTNKDITLLINGTAYNARLMNVMSSKSVQISYGSDVQAVFRQIFSYSDDYWTTIRQQVKALGQSTRGLPVQTVESISLLETDTPLAYMVECSSHFNSENPYDRDNLESEESITFPEGKKAYAKHARYERNQGIVRLAKDRFKATNGALFCEVCGFSYASAKTSETDLTKVNYEKHTDNGKFVPFMTKNEVEEGVGHHSVICYEGQYYAVYHARDIAGDSKLLGDQRTARICKLHFKDGIITAERM